MYTIFKSVNNLEEKVKSGQQIILSPQHILINLEPSVMIMPYVTSSLLLNERGSSKKILQSIRSDHSLFIFGVMSNPAIRKSPDDFYKVGVIAEAKADMKNPAIVIRGLFRAEMLALERIEGEDWHLWLATVKEVEDENCDNYFVENHQQIMADVMKIRDLLSGFIVKARGFYDFDDRLMLLIIANFESTDWGDKDRVDNFIWAVLSSIPDLLQKDKQPIIESTSLPERIKLCIKTLKKRLQLLEIQAGDSLQDEKLTRRAQNVLVTDPKDQEDIGQDDFIKGAHYDIKNQWEKFKEIRDHINYDAKKVIMEDFEKLKAMGGPQGNYYEWNKFMGQLKVLLSVPWVAETKQEADITKVKKVLDEDHYGLDHVKRSICDHVAPKILNPRGKGHIIDLSGAPGVGKTSLGKSIARALNRPFIRISLGGSRDVAQIKGHDITYTGSQPGEIIRAMIRCGYKNPVFMLDEIDKVGHMTLSGDVSAALLEVLDPEQNNAFRDLYMDAPYDLSNVMFITTSNVEDNIIPPLRDRMEVISLPGYLEIEKVEIAKRYLVPRWLTELGLAQNNVEVVLEGELISKIIRGYTNEAGVRNLERSIATILRKVCQAHLQSRNEGNSITKFEITEPKVHEFLGPSKFIKDRARPTVIGEAIGLAWTPVGGDILYVQAEFYDRLDGKKVLDLTGRQGKVMKESDKLALTRLMNILREANPELVDKLKSNSIHLHIPEGAIPKDGPSAGVTIFSALYSEATNKLVKQNLAMTGEIDNKARVLLVGGIREKMVAAERAGIKEIIMPKGNERNLYDVPKEIKNRLQFYFVETTDQVLEIAFPS